MQHDLVLEGRVVTPVGIQELEVGINEGKVAEIRRHDVKGERRIRGGRGLIFPGFIDIHVHMREPGWEYKEDFRTGSLAAIHGGVTTVADMPNNKTPADNTAILEEKKRLSDKSLVKVKLYAGVDPANLDRLAGLAGKAIGYKVYLARSTGDMMFPESQLPQGMAEVAKTGLPLSLHCEDQRIIDERTKKFEGVGRSDLIADIRPPEAEVESVRQVLERAAGVEGLRVNLCHISTGGALRLARAMAQKGPKISSEAALHHLFFNRKALLSNELLRTNPPLRGDDDRREMVGGLKDGKVTFLVTDHAPHTESEKIDDRLSGVPGLDDYGHVVSWLIRNQGVDPVTVAKVTSKNPAEFLGLADRGEIKVGNVADVTILDLQTPERVDRDQVRSKCGWSPYEGYEFPGKVRWTLRSGEVLLDDFEQVA